MALIWLPFSIMGVSTISVTTFFFFYITVYFRFPMSVLVQDPFSETSIYLVLVYLMLFSGYFTGSNMACDYVAKRILNKGITSIYFLPDIIGLQHRLQCFFKLWNL